MQPEKVPWNWINDYPTMSTATNKNNTIAESCFINIDDCLLDCNSVLGVSIFLVTCVCVYTHRKASAKVDTVLCFQHFQMTNFLLMEVRLVPFKTRTENGTWRFSVMWLWIMLNASCFNYSFQSILPRFLMIKTKCWRRIFFACEVFLFVLLDVLFIPLFLTVNVTTLNLWLLQSTLEADGAKSCVNSSTAGDKRSGHKSSWHSLHLLILYSSQ